MYSLGVVPWQHTVFGKWVHAVAPVVKARSQIPSEHCSVVAACVVPDSPLRPSLLYVLERLEKHVASPDYDSQ